jgi:hypothetical protein
LNTRRLLLPFTQGVDVLALEYAVLLAKNCNAILLPLSLISTSGERNSKGARLEHIQQSKDFLECVRHKAAKHGMSVNPIEAYTGNSVQHIKLLAQEMDCDGIILFVRDGKGVLLDTYETKHVITAGTSKLYIIRLQADEGRRLVQAALKDILHLPWRRMQQEEAFLNMQISPLHATMDQSEIYI